MPGYSSELDLAISRLASCHSQTPPHISYSFILITMFNVVPFYSDFIPFYSDVPFYSDSLYFEKYPSFLDVYKQIEALLGGTCTTGGCLPCLDVIQLI